MSKFSNFAENELLIVIINVAELVYWIISYTHVLLSALLSVGLIDWLIIRVILGATT